MYVDVAKTAQIMTVKPAASGIPTRAGQIGNQVSASAAPNVHQPRLAVLRSISATASRIRDSVSASTASGSR